MISQYTAHMNKGTDGRGTTILAKDGLILTNIQRTPSGRGIAATLNGIWIVNIYAPSGSEKRREREAFYNEEVATLLPPTVTEMILAGDFNCVLSQADCTGWGNYSKVLERLVWGLSLRDAWEEGPQRSVFTHYITKGASTHRQDLHHGKTQRGTTGCRSSSSCLYGSSGNYRTPVDRHSMRGTWKGILANECVISG
jgi:hypothetical protein